MSAPQSGITPAANTDALFLTFLLKEDRDHLKKARSACAGIPELTRNLARKHPDAQISTTISIGSAAWDRLHPKAKPEALTPFKALQDGDRVAPATPGDLLLHIRSNRKDINFILMREALALLGDSVELEEEVTGFRYLESRDLTGFVDGTENPEGDSRTAVALVGTEDSTFAGGTYIHCQRYIHLLQEWEQQPVAEQEKIIGRSKADDIEFSYEQKAPVAHIKRVNIKDTQGRGKEILRHSMPYGNAKEAGLFFMSCCRTPEHFEEMLEAMMLADSQGHYDHLMRFSKPVTGCAFFAPSIDFLEAHR
ncbi:MAG: Dyp-type peroxidase [Endozoicomonas sp.]